MTTNGAPEVLQVRERIPPPPPHHLVRMGRPVNYLFIPRCVDLRTCRLDTHRVSRHFFPVWIMRGTDSAPRPLRVQFQFDLPLMVFRKTHPAVAGMRSSKCKRTSAIAPWRGGPDELTHSFLIAKHLFPGFFTFFYAILNFSDLNMIAMPNSHLVLHKATLKQHFAE